MFNQKDVTNNPYIQFKVHDIPTTIPLDDYCKQELVTMNGAERPGAIIYVIDAKATPYDKACEYFRTAVATFLRVFFRDY